MSEEIDELKRKINEKIMQREDFSKRDKKRLTKAIKKINSRSASTAVLNALKTVFRILALPLALVVGTFGIVLWIFYIVTTLNIGHELLFDLTSRILLIDDFSAQ